MSTTATEPTASFSAALRAATAGDHAGAEHSHFMSALMKGTLPLDGYIAMLAQHHYAYEALEAPIETLRADAEVAPFLVPGLERLPALGADLVDLAGTDWTERFGPSEATVAYAARIAEVASTWPAGYVAHHYTRYLGDLSGGQHIGRVAARAYGLTPEHGGRFSRFEGIDPTAVKEAYRASLDAAGWDHDTQQKVIAEIRAAYRFNVEVFSDLDRYAV